MALRSPRAQRGPRVSAPHVDVTAAPIVKWVGGKTKLLPELLARMPESFGRYYEPFAGGAALFFRLVPRRAVLADSNADLIGLYRAIVGDVDGVIRRLEQHRASHDQRHYYDTRARWNDPGAACTHSSPASTLMVPAMT